MGFVDKIISSRGDLFYKVVATDTTNRRAYYFILLDKGKKEAFLKLTESDHFDLKDYGTIVESGYGEEPPEEIKQRLKEKYGFEF